MVFSCLLWIILSKVGAEVDTGRKEQRQEQWQGDSISDSSNKKAAEEFQGVEATEEEGK
jgi:hypothetical protein